MKVLKRNIVVVAVLLFVCAAVYLNWRFNQKEADIDVASQSEASETVQQETNAGTENAGLFYGEETETGGGEQTASGAADEYFAQARLTRQQARDEAAATLKQVTETEGAAGDTVNEAAEKANQIAEWTVKEAEMENLIIAKGYSDCVVFMSEDGVTVTVAVGEDGLSSAGAAQITEVICSGTDYTASQLKIIEIK